MYQSLDSQTRAAVQQFNRTLAGRFPAQGVIVYGSRARGTHRPNSDADVAVLLDAPAGPRLATALAMADLAYDVLLDTGINITPLPVWRDEWEHPERHSNPALLHAIAREGVRL